MKRNQKIVYVDTMDWLDMTHGDYLDFLADEGKDINEDEIDEREFDEWRFGESQLNAECFFDNLKYTHFDSPVMVTGSLGLWNGTHEIYAKRFDSKDYNNNYYDKRWRYAKTALEQAICACIDGCDDYEVNAENGVIEVIGKHHDGSNCFEIHLLSKKGINATGDIDGTYPVDVKPYWFKKFNDYLY